jgi:hypothetical protein
VVVVYLEVAFWQLESLHLKVPHFKGEKKSIYYYYIFRDNIITDEVISKAESIFGSLHHPCFYNMPLEYQSL